MNKVMSFDGNESVLTGVNSVMGFDGNQSVLVGINSAMGSHWEVSLTGAGSQRDVPFGGWNYEAWMFGVRRLLLWVGHVDDWCIVLLLCIWS